MPNATVHTAVPIPPMKPVLAGELDILLSDDTNVVASEPSVATAGIILLLDPHSIVIPKDPNRLPRDPEDERDQELLRGILAGGCNLVPIQVRQINVEPKRYQLVSGERRLLACIAARLLVRAMIVTSDEPSHDCLDRLRENLGRADLSPWEFGQQVRHAMQATQMSQTDLATTLGVSLSKVNRAFDLSDLPQLMVSAFASPNDIRVKDIKRLKDAWATDHEAVGLEVANIREEGGALAGPKVIDRIEKAVAAAKTTVDAPSEPEVAPCKLSLQVEGKAEIGHAQPNAEGGLDVHITARMSDLQRATIARQIVNIVDLVVLTEPQDRKTGSTASKRRAQSDAAKAETAPTAPASPAQPGA
ncbi:ParB/RepB/Spo0J family partition protein [Acidovorax sp. SUPP2522]|uniref:ParB/RepB/Spo0J family partition protein n=1 Tax=unclassified Acidovorax TaxID=2684926 RepID=UPI0023497F1C|nr:MULTISPECIES: ParB/RepB/Spo0J family partition protein [unclassified Acidovorax]WCM96383.1 ParB/RepB/Spo0J family partition protein [Acidovorax sp. GBBC 1281]GKT14964.1 ParB/RepB/Spo0J family partition protein [Acidovorax sp. SUPP2522]